MGNVKRDFYEVDGAARILDVSLSDLWHLIEVGQIEASFRQVMANVTLTFYDDFTVNDFIANSHTFILARKSATEVVVRGICVTKKALLYLAEPRERLAVDVNGDEFFYLERTIEFQLDNEVEVCRSDIVITQQAIDLYQANYKHLNSKVVLEKPLSTRTENNYLRLILTLANSIDGFNPKKPYEAAQLIIDETGVDISQQTISDYISKAYEIESKKRD